MSELRHIIITPLSTEQIKQLSVVEITDVTLLQDPRMGSQTDKCGTCGEYSRKCLGHYGHILLPYPVFSALLNDTAISLLDLVCLKCLQLPISLKHGDLRKQIKNVKSKSAKDGIKKCPHCGSVLERLQIEMLKKGKVETRIPIYFKCNKFQAYNIKKQLTGIDQLQKGSNDIVSLSQSVVQQILQNLLHQPEARAIVPYHRLFECFMIKALPVPPNSMRVLSQQTQSHAMNQVYTAVINSMTHLKDIQMVDDLFLPTFEKMQELHYLRTIIGCRVALSKDTSRNSKQQVKQILLDILGISVQEPASALSQCLTKKGWFRTHVSSVRVNMSARTVIVGDPWLRVDQVVIPKFFAENLYFPVRVNNANIKTLKALINNSPNYPCAVKRVSRGISYTINAENKTEQASWCQLGDIVMVQLIDGIPVIVNRYPSICEESLTCMIAKVEDTKTIKFANSVIKKMGADYDGDEMQIFVPASMAAIMEAVCLLSCSKQFITYERGTNIIGADPDQNHVAGIFHLQNEIFKNRDFYNITKKNDKEPITGIELIQKVFEETIYKNDDRLKDLNYEDKNIVVKNGKFEKIDVGLVEAGSQFLTFIQYHHSQQKAISIINHINHLTYQVNHVSASTVRNNMFLDDDIRKQISDTDQKRVATLQKIMDDYYTGNIVAPAGFDVGIYYEKLYQDRLYDNEQEQKELLLNAIEIPGKDFLNNYYKGAAAKVLSSVGHVGQQLDQGQRMMPDEYYNRTLPCFPKFQRTPQSEGYILGNFTDGLSQKEMCFNAMAERRNTYIKGNVTAIGGYLGRRINQGAGNMYAGANGIVYADGNQIVCTQYGCGGYSPRCYVVVKFDKHSIPIEEFDRQYKSHPRYKEMLEIRNWIIENDKIMKRVNPNFTKTEEMTVPFKFDQDSVSEEELDKLFDCRLCEKMSDGLKEIIVSQVYIFYIYALFFLKIDPKSKYNLVEKYIQSLVDVGETVGMKAALACSQPYTNGMLKAIHSKGGTMSIIREQKTEGVTRFQELVIGNKGPIIVQFQLLGKMKKDLQKNVDFVTKYQTIKFSDLKPQIIIKQSLDKYLGAKHLIQDALKDPSKFEKSNYSDYIIKIRFQIKQLAYYNVNIEDVMNQLYKSNSQIKQIIPYSADETGLKSNETDKDAKLGGSQGTSRRDLNDSVGPDKYIFFMIYSLAGISKQQIVMIKTYLLEQQILGSKLFYNFHMEQVGDEYKLVGNMNNENFKTEANALLKIHCIPGIDHSTFYCSDPKEYEPLTGIVQTKLSLYMELFNNLSTDKATKSVQCTHVKLMSDILTQPGILTSFTRNSYRKDDSRDMYSNMLFEQGAQFVADEVLNPQKQILNTMLNACIFGTRAELGSNVSEILYDTVLLQQDKKELQKLMDEEPSLDKQRKKKTKDKSEDESEDESAEESSSD